MTTEVGSSARSGDREPIAIIGIGCRYPGVHGPQAFWDLIRSDRSTVSAPPEHRIALGYDIDRYLDPRPRVPGRISSPFAGFLEHPELFDPVPFGLSPRDVRAMEPQQRLMVEVVWDAIVDAGIPPDSLKGERVAVILGHMVEDYSRERIAVLGEDTVNRSLDVFTVVGMSRAVLSGRVSFLLGLTGPSMTLDTACSSSLIATHLACQSLWSGESRLALAGGVNLFLTPEGNIALSRSGMLAPDGRCKAFDARADGFVRAEGAGVVLLRPLSDARAAGDPIYAVIRGTGISTDGRDGGHMMAPGRHGQAQAMRDAYASAGVSPADVDFVETHGTGTRIGDPVEIGALADVMGPGRSPERPLRVSSVKGHIGHAESASGVAGLISTALALAHRELPAQLHFTEPTPHIPWDDIPVRVQTVHEPWPGDGPRLAAVNSFGISGTNAHVVLEEVIEQALEESAGAARASSPETPGPQFFPFSAHDDGALTAILSRTAEHLRGDDAPALVDLAHTLARRREHHPRRFATVAADRQELLREIEARLAGRPSAASASGQADPHGGGTGLVLVFPGQGAQTHGMGRTLFESEPAFRRCIEELDAAYADHASWSLIDALRDPDRSETLTRLSRLQPTLVAVEIALASVWTQWGIRPDFVVGQSLGEIAAAHVAGCLDIATVARLACHRGEMVERAAGRGGMALVGLDESALEDWLRPHGGRLEIAGSSSPTTTIVSGDSGPIAALVEALTARDVFARRLEVDFASHCFHMDPLLDEFATRLVGLEAGPGTIPFYSTVDPGPLAGETLDAGYWVRNLRAPVAFTATLRRLLEAGASHFVEVSPHPTLARAIPETAAGVGHRVETTASLVRNRDERSSLLAGLAQLYVRGVPIAFDRVAPPGGRTLREAPYPYQRRPFWFGSRTRADRRRASHPLLGLRAGLAGDPDLSVWEKSIDLDEAPFLDDYRIDARRVLPAAIALETMLAAACEVWPGTSIRLQDVRLWPLREPDAAGRMGIQVTLRRDGADHRGHLTVTTRERDDEAWQPWARARVEVEASVPARAPTPDSLVDRARDADGPLPISPDDWHGALADRGLVLGPRMKCLRELALRRDRADARLSLARLAENESHAYFVHPALLETALALSTPRGGPATPSRIGELRLEGPLDASVGCRLEATHSASGDASLLLRADDGQALLIATGLRTRPIGSLSGSADGDRPSLHRVAWQRLEAPAIPVAANTREWILLGDDQAVSGLASALRKAGSRCHVGFTCADDLALHDDVGAVCELNQGFGLVWLGDDPDAPTTAGAGDEPDALAAEWLSSGLPIDTIWRIERSATTGSAGAFDGLRAAPTEGPSIPRSVRVRVGPSLDGDSLARLIPWLLTDTRESHLVASEGELYGARLAAACHDDIASWTGHGASAGSSQQFVARIVAPGEPSGFEFRERALPEPGPDQVRIAVSSAAPTPEAIERLLGLPDRSGDDDPSLPADLVGVVTARGTRVGHVAIGDRVVTRGELASSVCVDADEVVRVAVDADDATICTQARALASAMQLVQRHMSPSRGQCVLVHDPDGEFGWATLAIAGRAGARMLSTAGTPEDVAHCKALGVEVVAVADARDWTPAIRSATGGAGVDLLINFAERLPIDGGLAAIRPGGRLLDVRRRDPLDPGPVAGLRIQAGRSVCAVEPDALATTGAAHPIAVGEAIPSHLPAARVFPITESERALRFAAQRRGGGRVVIDFAGSDALDVRAADGRPRLFAGEARFAVVSDDEGVADRLIAWMQSRGAGPIERVGVSTLAERLDAWTRGEAMPLGVVAFDSGRVPGGPRRRARRRNGEAPASGPTAVVGTSPETTPLFLHLRSTADPFGGAGLHRADLRPSPVAAAVAQARQRGVPVSEVQWLGQLVPEQFEALLEAAFTRATPGATHVALAQPGSGTAEPDRSTPAFDEIRDATRGGVRAGALRDAWAALPGAERGAHIVAHLTDAVALVLGMGETDRARVVPESTLDELGLDSLMTLELAVGLHRDLGIELDRDVIGPGRSLSRIAESIGARLAPEETA